MIDFEELYNTVKQQGKSSYMNEDKTYVLRIMSIKPFVSKKPDRDGKEQAFCPVNFICEKTDDPATAVGSSVAFNPRINQGRGLRDLTSFLRIAAGMSKDPTPAEVNELTHGSALLGALVEGSMSEVMEKSEDGKKRWPARKYSWKLIESAPERDTDD